MDWFKLYSFDENEERTKKILEKFGINRYHFITINGIKGLIIEINLNVYRVEVHRIEEKLVVLKRKVSRRSQKHPHERMEVVKSFNNDCIYDSIKFVAEDSGIYRT